MKPIVFDPYSILVDFYDHWAEQQSDDIPFYVKQATSVRGPVVELGVGTGRVAIPIARAGQEVIGVDISGAMLTEAARRAAAHGLAGKITFVEEDMRTFVAEQPVELVIVPFRTFLHLLTVDDQLAALASIRRSLVAGGRLVLNMFVPDPHIQVAQNGRKTSHGEFIDERGRRSEMWGLPEYDVTSQLLHLRVGLDVYDGDRLVDTIETAFDLRAIHRHEFEHLLARAGFQVEALYGGFDERPLEGDAREQIWVARKP
ncbi:MAG TPA: class I SAM-dependent methyltransferase [Actinomycetota bacterium]|nr:class I SAM-dependent methyltransferase [Actinomycetota bacterium]